MQQCGYALVVEGTDGMDLDGAVVELRTGGPGMLCAIVRIPGPRVVTDAPVLTFPMQNP
jgi:hypothetical protein